MSGVVTLPLLANAQVTGVGQPQPGPNGPRTYQAWGQTGSSTGAATVQIRGSNNGGKTWDVIGTITLTLGTSTTSDSFTSQDRYAMVQANVSALSGTGAAVDAALSGGAL